MVVGGSVWVVSPWEDKSEFTYDEVVAMVKSGLLEQGFRGEAVESVTISGTEYVGNGKWLGTGFVEYEHWSYGIPRLGEKRELMLFHDTANIEWNFYEKSGTTEIIRIE